MSAPQTFKSEWSRNVYETKSIARQEPDTSYDERNINEKSFSNVFEAATGGSYQSLVRSDTEKTSSIVKSQRSYRDSIGHSGSDKKSKQRRDTSKGGRVHSVVENVPDQGSGIETPLKPVVKEVFIPDFNRTDSMDDSMYADEVDDDVYTDDEVEEARDEGKDDTTSVQGKSVSQETGGLSDWKGLASALGRPSVDDYDTAGNSDDEEEETRAPWHSSSPTDNCHRQESSSMQARRVSFGGHDASSRSGKHSPEVLGGSKAYTDGDLLTTPVKRHRHHKQPWQARNQHRKGGAGVIRPKKETDSDGTFSLKPAKFGTAWEPLGKLPVDPYNQKALAETVMSTRAREDFDKHYGYKSVHRAIPLSPEQQEHVNRLALPKELTRATVNAEIPTMSSSTIVTQRS